MTVQNFLKDETGVTSIEYALIGVLISISIVVAAGNVGGAVTSQFQAIESAFS
ncbi:MAG: Flp family type IVb pilin [Pseudomonadota bacterium]